MGNKDFLKKAAKQLNIDLSEEQVNQFVTYMDLLLKWNEKVNLTAITEENDIITKHFVDSISCILSNRILDGNSLIDVGTGAGFPGIPLKIVRNSLRVTLLDSLNKRVHFLNEVIDELKLSGIQAVHARAEDAGANGEYRETYDAAISRAVANLAVLVEYALPFVKVGGYFIAMKGPDVEEEIKQSKKAINILGGEINELKSIRLPFTDISHSLVIIRKVSKCPTKYPRKAGKPSKNPLI